MEKAFYCLIGRSSIKIIPYAAVSLASTLILFELVIIQYSIKGALSPSLVLL